MAPKIGQLAVQVQINQGFPGNYVWKGGTSYYLNGEKNTGDIHFSVPGNEVDDFTSFHITPQVLDGTNVGIWFHGETWSNNNTNNLPTHKKDTWETWWRENQLKVKQAAADFWNKLSN